MTMLAGRKAASPARSRCIFVITWLALAATVPPALCQDADEGISQVWDQVSALRLEGRFQEATDLLNQVILEHSHSEDILRIAYNQLVFTLMLLKDEQMVEAKAQEALELFPDLDAPGPLFPPQINDRYARLRREMFGAFAINKPVGGRVLLDGEFRGVIPFQIDLLRVGEHELAVMRSGYIDHEETIRILPSGEHRFEISMDRRRDRRWWLTRIGAGVVTGVILSVALSGDDGGAAPAGNLPFPPDPPPR